MIGLIGLGGAGVDGKTVRMTGISAEICLDLEVVLVDE